MKILSTYILILSWISMSGTAMPANAPKQDDKARVRLQLNYFKTPEGEYLTTRAMGRLERRYEPIDSIGISFYLGEVAESFFLGRIATDPDGRGQLYLPQLYDEIAADLDEMVFIAVLNTNPVYEDKTTELTIKKVDLDIQLFDEDSIKQITVKVSERDSMGVGIPQAGVEVKFFVKRPLGNLPISEGFNVTDEEGNIGTDFPTDLPGGPKGELTLVIRIEDNDTYGNIELREDLNWGVPMVVDRAELRRSLWASGANAPIPLLLLVNALILAVWGIIFYIIFRIYKISKI